LGVRQQAQNRCFAPPPRMSRNRACAKQRASFLTPCSYFATHSTCTPKHTNAQHQRRDKFAAYRKAGLLRPFHVRRTPYKCRMHSLGGNIIKEYAGARQKVCCWLHGLAG